MPRTTPVSAVMSADVLTVKPDDSILDAIRTMAEQRIGALPVVDPDGLLVGMLEDDDIIVEEARVHEPVYLDILWSIIRMPGSAHRMEEELKKITAITVADAMKTEFSTVNPDNTIEDVATIMLDAKLSRLPVVDGDRLVGLVTRGDLIQAIARRSE